MRRAKSLDSLSRSRCKFRVHLSRHELEAAAMAVYGHMEYNSCSLFNTDIPSEEKYLKYIDENPKIGIATHDIGLPKKIYGSVVKKQMSVHGRPTNFYLIIVSHKVTNPVERLFTIAHELGHILLHGRLLSADLSKPRQTLTWSQPLNRLYPMMEVEANIFALFCLIPRLAISKCFSEVPNTSTHSQAKLLKHFLESKYKCSMDLDMVFSRLWLYSILEQGASTSSIKKYFENHEQFDHVKLWITRGLSKQKSTSDMISNAAINRESSNRHEADNTSEDISNIELEPG